MSRVRSLAVVPAYLILTLLLTWPLAANFARALPAGYDPVDPLMQAFILGWDWKALATRPLHVLDAPSFHPLRHTLTYMDHLLGEAAVGSPVAAATGSVPIAYNALVVLSFVATAWAAYRLVRFLGASRGASFLGGFVYAFGPYRMSQLSNMNQLHLELVPLGLLFALRARESLRWRDLLAVAATLVAQSLFGWYYAFHLALGVVLVVAWATLVERRRWTRAEWTRVLVAEALAGVLLFASAIPYWLQHAAMPAFKRSLGKAALYSADLVDFVRTNHENRLLLGFPPRGDDQAYWFGLVTIVLAVLGLRHARRAADRCLLALGGVGFVLALGPVLQVAGHRLPVPLPYAAFYYAVPGFASMRAPGRFAELALLAAALLAARGWDAMATRANTRSLARPALFAVALGVASLEFWSAPIPMVTYPSRASRAPVYEWLATMPGTFAILELPMPASEAEESVRDAERQLEMLDHGKPRADGVSGFSPPEHERFRRIMQSFPDAEAVAAARARGVRFVIVRTAEMDSRAVRRVELGAGPASGLRAIHRFGSDWVYEVVSS